MKRKIWLNLQASPTIYFMKKALKYLLGMEIVQPEEQLYIFLHIQKCAGRTIILHAMNQFGEAGVFHDGRFTAELAKQYGGMGPRTLILEASKEKPFMKKQWFSEVLQKYKGEWRKQLRLIGGHRAYYGMHEFVEKPARYFTFLREPVSRIISWYNNVLRLSLEHQKILKTVRDDGQRVSFEEWLGRVNLAAHSMTAFLALRYYGENVFDFDFVPTEKDFEKAKEALRQMYFIGLTESGEDKDFMYQRLGITQFISNQNVGKEQSSYFYPQNYEAAKELILTKCPFDYELYEYAKTLNQEMKMQIEDYYRAVAYTRFRRRVFTKTQALFSQKFFQNQKRD